MYKYKRNSNIFSVIDTEEKAYWLGFLYADGYLNEQKGFIDIGLKRSDREHVEKFKSFLETDNPIVDTTNNGGYECSRFRLYDKKIVADLVNQGLFQKKSLTIRPNFQMAENLIIHWTRGVFDGDGSIFPHQSPRAHLRYYLDLIGTEEMLLYIQGIWRINRKLDYNRKIPKFTVCKKTEVNRILHLLYDNSKIFLERKKKLAYEAININLQ